MKVPVGPELTASMRCPWMLRNEKGRPPATLTTENLWLLPGGITFLEAEIEVSHKIGRETRLKEALAPIIDNFDYIIIDTPPSLGLLSINALSAANWVMVPVQAEYYSLEGFSMLSEFGQDDSTQIGRNLKMFRRGHDHGGRTTENLQARIRWLEHPTNCSAPPRRLVNVAEAPWSGAPTVLLNKPTSSEQAPVPRILDLGPGIPSTRAGHAPRIRRP